MPATVWQLRTRQLDLRLGMPLLMGIVNVTPDSFSDGGKFLKPQAAIEHALQLVADGADILDIGGESTRPYSEPVSTEEELHRVLLVIESLRKQTQIPISIDTSKATVAQAAIDAGAEIVNDVTAFSGDAGMIAVAQQSGVGVCAMHMQGIPHTMQDNPTYRDVISDVLHFLRDCRDQLAAAGISKDRICLDPGIGFGKTTAHNLVLLRNASRFHELECPLLFGPSRKGFVGQVLGDKAAERTAGSIGVCCTLATQGVQILRVHDVLPVRQALSLFAAASPR